MRIRSRLSDDTLVFGYLGSRLLSGGVIIWTLTWDRDDIRTLEAPTLSDLARTTLEQGYSDVQVCTT